MPTTTSGSRSSSGGGNNGDGSIVLANIIQDIFSTVDNCVQRLSSLNYNDESGSSSGGGGRRTTASGSGNLLFKFRQLLVDLDTIFGLYVESELVYSNSGGSGSDMMMITTPITTHTTLLHTTSHLYHTTGINSKLVVMEVVEDLNYLAVVGKFTYSTVSEM